MKIKKRYLKWFLIIILIITLITTNLFLLEKHKKAEKSIIFETNYGNFTVKLNSKKAPITTNNFLYYAQNNLYKGTIFHRSINGFVIQGGGFYPTMKPIKTKEPITLESNNNLSNKKWTIAMARTNSPNSATSQFFINLEDNSKTLDYKSKSNPGYAVFGKITQGFQTIEKMIQIKTTTIPPYQDVPTNDIIIKNIQIK